jgi:hypothetical protein
MNDFEEGDIFSDYQPLHQVSMRRVIEREYMGRPITKV